MKALKRAKLVTLFLCAFLGLSGCVASSDKVTTKGTDFDAAKVARIEKEKTTSAETLEMFGNSPIKTLTDPEGELWEYSFETERIQAHVQAIATVSGRSEGSGYRKTLVLLLNKDGRVSNFTLNEGAMPPTNLVQASGKTHGTVGVDLDKSKADWVLKGKTSLDEVVKVFGLPRSKKPLRQDMEDWIYKSIIFDSDSSGSTTNEKTFTFTIGGFKFRSEHPRPVPFAIRPVQLIVS